MAWNPFGVLLEISATAGTVTRTSATQFTVRITAAWETYYSGAQTNYGMTASSGGGSATLNPFGTKSSGGSAAFTGTYSISGNAGATKTVTVTFRNFNNDNGDSATKTVNLSVTVPAWTSYTVKYNANGGSGAPSSQTKWKDQALTLSSTKPTRTGYTFQGWATSASGGVAYAAGASYTANAAVTLYAVWKANTYTVTYNANGGSGAPGSQTKTYGVALTLSSTKPTRTNYTFKGWGTSASATTVAYAAGGSYTANATITLYAIWELAYTKPRLTNVTVKDALNHPNWSMGAKITIDSASLMNKGLEVIEAVHLFGVPASQIEVLIHRQSILHSAVELSDGAVIAQLGTPDMKLPIQYALTYPNREMCFENLDLFKVGTLTFERPDYDTFRSLPLCIEAINRGGLYPTAINGANEESVKLFLEGKIKFLQIAEINEKAMNMCENKHNFSVDDIFEADLAARKIAREAV